MLSSKVRATAVPSLCRAAVLALGVALAGPSGVLAADGRIPTAEPAPATAGLAPATAGPAPATAAGDFSINLYRQGDFVSQATPFWCVGASMQMMLNISGVTDDSRAAQARNMQIARSFGSTRRQANDEQGAEAAGGALRGAGSAGWARGLVTLGAGPYVERAVDGYGPAIQAAVRALRTTGRPVGLIVWRGAHAWVVRRFTATADPLTDADYRVTGVYIQDPWYPRVSSIWGPGQKPNTWISVDALKADFLPRSGGGRHVDQVGKYVLVLPVDPPRQRAGGGRMS